MKYFKAIFTLSLLLCVGKIVYSQSARTYLKSAEENFADKDYYNASVNYKKALEIDSSKVDIMYKYAEACRLAKDYRPAERYYKIVMDKDKTVPPLYPLASFNLAMMKKYNAKYTEAKKYFKSYAGKHKADNNYYSIKSKYEISACDAALTNSKLKENATVMHMDTSVNSQYDDFAPFQLGDSIFYFTSIRSEKTFNYPKSKDTYTIFLSRLFKSYRRDSIWVKTKELSAVFNAPDMDNANCSFSPDQKRFYFTRTKPNGGTTEIYVSTLAKGNKFSPPVRLNDPVNIAGYNTTQPMLASNGKKGDFLFFSSDRPGGKGKFDIYVCNVTLDGKYSQPVNIGEKINSIDDEVTPFFDAANQTLYFSSEWHKSLGGLDIFKSKKTDQGWSDPIGLGYPINTNYNETSFTINPNTKDGYFASNRVGTVSNKGETCCNDIYFFELTEIKNRLDSIRQRKEFSKKISEELNALTPITLYFDNDAPEPHSEDTITSLDYETTYHDYVSLKKDYEDEFSKGLTGANKETAVKDIDDLFNNNIIKGFNSLEKFCTLVAQNLEYGKNVKMTIKGYTSPLAKDEYNINLAKRRLKSLRNYINEFGHGAIADYLNGMGESGATLTIVEEAIGEAAASKSVSDNPNDEKNAVYSRASALERKIQITDVIITDAPPAPKREKKVEKKEEVKPEEIKAETPKEESKTEEPKDEEKPEKKAPKKSPK